MFYLENYHYLYNEFFRELKKIQIENSALKKDRFFCNYFWLFAKKTLTFFI